MRSVTKIAFRADDCSPLVLAEERGELSLSGYGRGQYPGLRLAPGQLPGLRSIGVWDAVGRQNWGLPFHRNEGIEICYLLHGQCEFATDEGSWSLQSGDMTITRPWQRHRVGNPHIHPCKLFWFILDVDASTSSGRWSFPDWIAPDAESRLELLRCYRQHPRCHLREETQERRGVVEQLCSSFVSEPSRLQVAALSAGINYLLVSVADSLSRLPEDSAQDPEGFDATIRQFYRGLEASVEKAAEAWTLEEIAHACRVGKSYLSLACRRLFNHSPVGQLNVIRLEHAARMLREKPLISVTEIAFTCGFNSSQYFARSFRKRFASAPAAYRRQPPG